MQGLYHFTSPRHVGSIQREGITRGVLPLRVDPPYEGRSGFQWLTANPDPDQSWNEGSTLPYDRTAWRLMIGVPEAAADRLHWWPIWGPVAVPLDVYRTLSEFGDPENWYVFAGRIPPDWIIDVERVR